MFNALASKLGLRGPQASKEVERELQKLETTRKDFLDIGLTLAKAFGGALYPVDLLTNAVLKRSLALTAGFCLLIRNENYLCAASLVRLHLDSLLRLSAVWLVEKPHDFASAVLEGKQVRDLTDEKGRRMTDRFLVECLGTQEPWVIRVYEATSGFIHLSKAHIFQAHHPTTEAGKWQIAIGEEDDFIPDSLRVEACLAMQAITNKILWFLDGWRQTKENPPGLKAKI
jgi:hypothetical protein